MAARKSRSRKTADKMASYKQHMKGNDAHGSRRSPSRKSPRGKPSKSQEDVVTRTSGGVGTNKRGGKDPSDIALDGRDDGMGLGTSRLEGAVEIPETPPRVSQVAGRKRAIAPRSLNFESDASQEGVDDLQVPSKKRKSFNTPPRQEAQSPQDTRVEASGQSGVKSTSLQKPSDQTGEREGVTDIDHFDPDPGCGNSSALSKPKELAEDFDELSRDWAFSTPPKGKAVKLSKSHFHHDHDLEVLSVSSEALSRLFESFRKKMTEETRGLHRHLLSGLRENNESLKAALLSEVKDIRGVVEMMSTGGKNSSSGISGPQTLLSTWEKKLNSLTPKTEVIFNKSVFARIVCYNAPMKVVEVYRRGTGSNTEKISAAVQALLFSLQPKGTKFDLSQGTGKLRSEFKYSVVQNVFYNVCKDTFDLFRSPLAGPEQAAGPVLSPGKPNRIARPNWLEVGYVTVNHINVARRLTEEAKQSRRSKIRETPSPDDIASHGALRVYRLLGSHLHKGREYMRPAFFQGLGYLFVPWKKYVNDSDQRKMSLSFPAEDEEWGNILDDIPSTELCSFAADPETANQVNAANKNLLKSMFSKWPGMVLQARHEVHVTSGGGAQRKHSGGECRKLNRLINLIEVACNVIVEFTRVGSIDLFLRSHKSALRCVMIFAFLFKELTKEFISMSSSMDIDGEEHCVPEAVDVNIHDTCLKEFLPGATIQEAYLKGRCLRFDEKIYEMLHQPEDVTEDPSGPRSGHILDVTRIEECDELGVASI